MKSQISLAFQKCKKENRPALLTYTVAGDNTKKKSLEILKSISEHADILELGFAHNAPTADGPQIQNSSYRALKNGIKLKDVFQIIKDYKKIKNAKPCILMGYYQMVYRYGERKFIKKCKQVGVSGLIIVDLPFPDNIQFAKLCKKIQLLLYSYYHLLHQKKDEKIIASSHDMIYYISMLSTTGGKLKTSPNKILKNYFKIKRLSKTKNTVIGFGITEKQYHPLKKAMVWLLEAHY